jgi:hypothetical protein
MIPEHLRQRVRHLLNSDAEFAAFFTRKPLAKNPRLPDPENNPTIQLQRDQGLFDDPVRRETPTAAQIYWSEIDRLWGKADPNG